MNLSNLGLFRNISLRSDKRNRQFAVIGLGRFGRAVCMTMHQLGHEVLGVDSDERRVSQILTDQIASHAVQLDSTDPNALREAGLFEFETVIVAIGNYIQESIITTLNVKEAGVPIVVAKASSEVHGKLLMRVGADHVVYPEHEAGTNLARSLTRPGILDRFELDPDNSIVEVVVPAEFDGKSILELDLRSRYRLNVLAIIKSDQYTVNPDPNERLEKGSMIVVIGDNSGIDELPTQEISSVRTWRSGM